MEDSIDTFSMCKTRSFLQEYKYQPFMSQEEMGSQPVMWEELDGDFEQLDMRLYLLHNLQEQNRSPANTKRNMKKMNNWLLEYGASQWAN